VAGSKPLEGERVLGALQDILIALLGTAGVPQLEIRKIVGVDIHRVNRIVKYMKIKGR
jgi:hypothetical protein